MGVSHTTVRRVVQENLKYKSYVLKVRQMLSETAKAKKLARYNSLVCSLKYTAAGSMRFFSDEKIFTVDAKMNRRNDRRLVYNLEDVPVVVRKSSFRPVSTS